MVKYILLSGGLGNQMFQYVFYKSLIKKGYHCILDGSFYKYKSVHTGYRLNDCFVINDMQDKKDHYSFFYRMLYKVATKRNIPTIFMEKTDYYNDEKMYSSKYILNGYWQSEKYFSNISEEIKEIFKFKNISNCAKKISYKMQGDNVVAIHVRRGDYLSSSKYIDLSNTKYYDNSITYIKKRVNNPEFYVFSDDIEWCKRNILKNEKVTYINEKLNDYEEMYLMSLSPNIIQANSSFSWWASYLGTKKLHLRPAKNTIDWTEENDKLYYPSSWIKINLD